ncbi:MAG: YitT family protein [Oscillospiraceae bacterium]|nr:YitT family protein [Oscillospiraceae bacterium]
MKKYADFLLWLLKMTVGCFLFGLGFDLFLEPYGMNSGGISGLAMVLVHLLGYGTVGTLNLLINLPLFVIGGLKIGRKFFFGSLVGMLLLSTAIDLCALIPVVEMDPLLAAIYGGALCGGGLGMVFVTGASTGGSDIIVRLLKLKYQNVPIGTINIFFDMVVALLTGLVFQDLACTLYSGVAIFLTGQIVDAVVYRFDYSKVALIISVHHEQIAKAIGTQLRRGCTYLHGQGAYSGADREVILTAVKKQQLAELKQLVVEIDPDAFIIVQEAHQVLGDGFARYSKHAL